MKNLLLVASALAVAIAGSPVNAQTLLSTALDGDSVGNGLAGAFASQAAHVTTSIDNGGGTTDTVTTTLTSLNSVAGLGNDFPSNNFAVDTSGGENDGIGWAEWTFQAVDAAAGMDVTYLVRIESWFWDDSAGVIVASRGRGNGGRIGNWANGLRDDISNADFEDTNDYEFVRVTISQVSSDGANQYSLDGITSVQVNNDQGVRIDDLNGGGTIGTSLGDGGGANVTALSTPSLGFDYIAISGDAGSNFENRMIGFAASFTAGSGSGGPLTLAISPSATSGNLDFSWSGRTDKVYDLVSSLDLSTDPETWPVWEGLTNLAGVESTNSLTDVPNGGDSVRFFALIEKNPPPPGQ